MNFIVHLLDETNMINELHERIVVSVKNQFKLWIDSLQERREDLSRQIESLIVCVQSEETNQLFQNDFKAVMVRTKQFCRGCKVHLSFEKPTLNLPKKS